jgi:hypothetical protein
MLDLCAADADAPQFDGPSACNQGSYGDATACQFRARCGPSADLGGGITVWQVQSENRADCEEYGANTAWCSCQVGNARRQTLLNGVTLPEACQYAHESCEAVQDVPIDRTEQCAAPYTSETASSCSIHQDCTQLSELEGGVSAEVRSSVGAGCEQAGDTWACRCDYGRDASIGFNVAPAATPGQTCDEAVDLCAVVQDVAPSGPLACEFQSRNSAPESCGQANRCSATVPVEDVAVQVFGYVNANCTITSEDVWLCECFSDRNYDSFEVSTSDAAADVCNAAATECQRLVEIELFGAGG